MIFAQQKFIHYLLARPFIFYTDHQALKYLVCKLVHLGRVCRWLLLFQEFEFEVIIRPRKNNVGPDCLSRVEIGEEATGIEATPKELAKIVQFLQEGKALESLPEKNKKVLAMKVAPFTLKNGYVYKLVPYDILRRCVLEHERGSIIEEAHVGYEGGAISMQIA